MEISAFLPVRLIGNKHEWILGVQKLLTGLSQGPVSSRVQSGEKLFDCILRMQQESGSDVLEDTSASQSLELFFQETLPEGSSQRFFDSTLPSMAKLALHLPDLLERQRELKFGSYGDTRLRVLPPQEPGIVFLSQELVASLLACSFLCAYPIEGRSEAQLPMANFTSFFSRMHSPSQQQKMLCMLNYFQRVCEEMPQGVVSYERKVLFPKNHEQEGSWPFLPDASSWKSSRKPLCRLKVMEHGTIEDHEDAALEIDFANEFLGGGALRGGCVQEEIRFMVNPELIAGMVFLPKMDENEAIEIYGVERFSAYQGYGKRFCFAGDYSDHTERDRWGRRLTRIVAIDALARPGLRQFEPKMILREVNKAYCGFLDQDAASEPHSTAETVGVATGNWGCGAFGGDVELKSMIQWLAASQAQRPFVQYYSFNDPRALKLQETVDWIAKQSWNTGELWSLLLEYGNQRQAGKAGEVETGFFQWIRSATGMQALFFRVRRFISSLCSSS